MNVRMMTPKAAAAGKYWLLWILLVLMSADTTRAQSSTSERSAPASESLQALQERINQLEKEVSDLKAIVQQIESGSLNPAAPESPDDRKRNSTETQKN